MTREAYDEAALTTVRPVAVSESSAAFLVSQEGNRCELFSAILVVLAGRPVVRKGAFEVSRGGWQNSLVLKRPNIG